jgi:hypothetical protein
VLEATLADRVRLTAERDGLQISNDAYATTNRQLVANLESERSLGMAETHQLRAEAEKRATELAETHAALKGARAEANTVTMERDRLRTRLKAIEGAVGLEQFSAI